MSIELSRALVVPEYESGRVSLYVAHPATGETVAVPPYTLDLQRLVSTMLPGRTAKANSCALSGTDLFVSNSSPDSQCVFKVTDYLVRGGLALSEAFVVTLDGNDYVGLAVDGAGHLYAAEGSLLDNRIVRYAGADAPYPGPAAASLDNHTERIDLGNAGMSSYFANLAFDPAGNLWATDYKNSRLVVFDAGQLGTGNTYHVLGNLAGPIQVETTHPALSSPADHLFASPEGLAFDVSGTLWVANNNDGATGVQNQRTSLIAILPALQSAVLGTAPNGDPLVPDAAGRGTQYAVYQVPNLADDLGLRPQFGGMQIDRSAGRMYVNEEIALGGRAYDLDTLSTIGTHTADNDLAIVSTNPGNGGMALVERQTFVVLL
jgi:sugar lactone lactonase YvrE